LATPCSRFPLAGEALDLFDGRGYKDGLDVNHYLSP
jgi:hypothetical protein